MQPSYPRSHEIEKSCKVNPDFTGSWHMIKMILPINGEKIIHEWCETKRFSVACLCLCLYLIILIDKKYKCETK